MNIKPNIIQFQGEFEDFPNESLELKTKIRKSYAGGFRMFKSPEAPKPQESFRNLKKEIEVLKEKTRQVKKPKKKPPEDYAEPNYHIEENKHIHDINNLEQLQHLKEQKALRIVEIEAELKRVKLEEKRSKERFEPKTVKQDEKTDKKALEASERIEKREEFRRAFLLLDKERKGFVSLDEITEEISKDLDLSKLFCVPASFIDVGEIFEYLLRIVKTLGKNQEMISLEDFCEVGELAGFNREFRVDSQRVVQPKCVLDNEVVFVFETVFDSFFSDYVNKFVFLDSLLANSEVQERLSAPAVQVSETEVADLAAVLHYIRTDTQNPHDNLAWHEFLSYFYLTSPKLPKQCLDLFREVFESISSVPGCKVSTYDLISALNSTPSLSPFLSIPITDSESLSEILEKIKDQAPSFLTLQDFLHYFTPPSHLPSHPSPKSFKPTKPEPFKFEARETLKKSSKPSIREQKFKQMLEEKEKLEQFHLNFRPKPTKILKCIKEPLYEQMVERQKMRSEEIKRESIERTLRIEKPFSFYERDKSRTKPEPLSPQVFKFRANPIPRSSSVPLFEKMMRNSEVSRKERVAARAQEMMRESSLPPRMALYSNQSKSFSNLVVDELTPHKFKPKDPPEFKKLHEKFQKTLESKKQARKPTIPAPFTIDERAEDLQKKRKKEKSDSQNTFDPKPVQFKARDPPDFPKLFESFQRSLHSKKVEKQPVTTQPFEMEKRVQEMKEKKEKKEEDKKRIEEEKGKDKEVKVDQQKVGNLKGLKEKLQKAICENIKKSKDKGADLDTRARQKKMDAEEQAKKYKESLREMNLRVYNKPLLIDLEAQTVSLNLAKGKALHTIKSQLKSSNLLSKNYFNTEEQALISLYESHNP